MDRTQLGRLTAFAERRRGVQHELEQQLETETERLMKVSGRLCDLDHARDFVNTVLLVTQGRVKGFIEDVVTLALSSVYGDEYQFRLEYSVKRNQPEARPVILKDGDEFDPRSDVGGGVVDVASLGLRLVAWAMQSPQSAAVLILDEPAKFVSGDKVGRVGTMIHEVSRLLSIQVIMVSHEEELIETADRSFRVIQSAGVSRVERVS